MGFPLLILATLPTPGDLSHQCISENVKLRAVVTNLGECISLIFLFPTLLESESFTCFLACVILSNITFVLPGVLPMYSCCNKLNFLSNFLTTNLICPTPRLYNIYLFNSSFVQTREELSHLLPFFLLNAATRCRIIPDQIQKKKCKQERARGPEAAGQRDGRHPFAWVALACGR